MFTSRQHFKIPRASGNVHIYHTLKVWFCINNNKTSIWEKAHRSLRYMCCSYLFHFIRKKYYRYAEQVNRYKFTKRKHAHMLENMASAYCITLNNVRYGNVHKLIKYLLSFFYNISIAHCEICFPLVPFVLKFLRTKYPCSGWRNVMSRLCQPVVPFYFFRFCARNII